MRQTRVRSGTPLELNKEVQEKELRRKGKTPRNRKDDAVVRIITRNKRIRYSVVGVHNLSLCGAQKNRQHKEELSQINEGKRNIEAKSLHQYTEFLSNSVSSGSVREKGELILNF